MAGKAGTFRKGDGVMVPLGKLAAADWTFNRMDERVFRALADNVGRWGMDQPLLVRPRGDGKYEVVDGHHRLRAAAEAGLREIECVIREMSRREAMERGVSMNKVRGWSDPVGENETLRELAEGVDDRGELAKLLGYSDVEFRAVLALLDEVPQDMLDRYLAAEDAEDDGWVNLAWRVPPELAERMRAQVARAAKALGLRGPRAVLALEALAGAAEGLSDGELAAKAKGAKG